MILNNISADAVETDKASKTRRHLLTYGNKSELVIDRVSVVQSHLTFVAPHFPTPNVALKLLKSGKLQSTSVNIPCTFASFKWWV